MVQQNINLTSIGSVPKEVMICRVVEVKPCEGVGKAEEREEVEPG